LPIEYEAPTMPATILCLASYFKGGLFIEEAKRLGCYTILLTPEKHAQEDWPRHAIDQLYTVPLPALGKEPDITYTVSYLGREREIHRIVALDDYDVETAAALREHLRLPGIGASQARFFRDKLAMRMQAQACGVLVPEFTSVVNRPRLAEWMARVPAPWVLKPRGEASSMGIRKVHHAHEVWDALNALDDRQTFFVLERFVPGAVYHVDSVVWQGEILAAVAHRYGVPPMAVYHGGGVFASTTLPYGSEEEQALQAINAATVRAMGMRNGVTHAEFIRAEEDGRYYFLEIASRVGGAGIDRLVEHASNLNPWVEWARIEVAALRGEQYHLPPRRWDYGGLIVSLARQEWPDTAAYADPEVCWQLRKAHHVGFVLASPDHARVQWLVSSYIDRIACDFTASQPPMEKAPG
jgi:biotin carboxylase